MGNKELDAYWEFLIDYMIATEEELQLITSINGYNQQTLDDVLYVRTGNRSKEQYCDENDIECDDLDESAVTKVTNKILEGADIRTTLIDCPVVTESPKVFTKQRTIEVVLPNEEAFFITLPVPANIKNPNGYIHNWVKTHLPAKADWDYNESKKISGVKEASTVLRDKDITSTDDVDELVLYITNDGQLYRNRTTPIINNLKKKYQNGQYDKDLAVKAFMYLADDGVRKYDKEFVSGQGKLFLDKATREEIAKQLRDHYEEEICEK